MIQIEFNHQKQIIYSTWKGNIYLDDIYDYINKLSELRSNFNCLFILQDATSANILINHTDDLLLIVNKVMMHLACFRTIYMAHVVIDPQQTVLAIMYNAYLADNPKFINEIFCTHQAATQWLKTHCQTTCQLAHSNLYAPNQCHHTEACEICNSSNNRTLIP